MNSLQEVFSIMFPQKLVADSSHGLSTLNTFQNVVQKGERELEESCSDNPDLFNEIKTLVSAQFSSIDKYMEEFIDESSNLFFFNSTADVQELAMIMAQDVKKSILDCAIKYVESLQFNGSLNEGDDPTYSQKEGSDYSPSTHQVKKKRPNLPSQAKAILSDWFRNHVDNPYPNQIEKQELSNRTGLSLQKVDNWFINERSRKWDNYRKRELRN